MATLAVFNVQTTPFGGVCQGRVSQCVSPSLCRPGATLPRRGVLISPLTSDLCLKGKCSPPRRSRVKRYFAVAEQGTNNSRAKVVVPDKSVSVILLAGGKGKRMGANMPKQYLPLLGQPIALHSFYTFAAMSEVVEIIVVCDPSYRDIFEDARVSIPLKFALPGKERQDSVHSGLKEISKASKLACIHDSARPLVQVKDIRQVLTDAWTTGAAVLGVPCKATIKEAGKGRLVEKTLDRKTLWEIQTPQVIEPDLLHRGFELVVREGYEVTDDVSIVEYLKHPVLITEGSYTNLKVTTPEDMLVAERILHNSDPTNIPTANLTSTSTPTPTPTPIPA